MSLPSLVDVVTVVVLLLPGFVSFILFKWISVIERKFSDFEMVVCSLFLSLLIYAIFSSVTGISSIDTIRDSIFYPVNLSIVLGLSVTLGIIPGLISKYGFRQRYIQGDCWNTCMDKAESSKHYWVLVYTEKGEEYKGRIHFYRKEGEHTRELVIEEPILIKRDETGTVTDEMKMGEELLFLEPDIRRIVFLEALREPSPQ